MHARACVHRVQVQWYAAVHVHVHVCALAALSPCSTYLLLRRNVMCMRVNMQYSICMRISSLIL